MKQSKRLLAAMLVILMLVTAVPLTSLQARAANIPKDAKQFNGHWYYFYETSITWKEAKKACENRGGHLVTLTSERENNFVKSLLGKNKLSWIGLYQKDKNSPWHWVTKEKYEYCNWTCLISGTLYDYPNYSISALENYAYLHTREEYANGWDIRLNEGLNANVEYSNNGWHYLYSMNGYVCEWDIAGNYVFSYNSTNYTSSAYDDFEDNSGWQTVEETVIKSGEFDWAKAVVGAISANTGDALSEYYDISKDSVIYKMDTIGGVITMLHGFVCGGREGINDVTMKLQTNGKESRMLLMYGQPIETAYGGQTLYYSEILTNAHSGDASYVLYAHKDADKDIRSIFSGLEPDGRYDLRIKYSKMKDWTDSPFKYTIVIGKNGKVIQYPIFHNGTKVELCYYAPKGKKGYSTDITRLLNSETIEVEEQVGKDIINFLNSGTWKKNPKNQIIRTGYDHYAKTLGNGAFSLNAKAKTALSFTSDNKKIATVNSKGKVTIVGVGTAKIRIIATGTNKYNSASKYVTITVRPKTPTISKIRRTAVDQAVIKWKTIEGASGYKVQYAPNKDLSDAKTVLIPNGARSSYTIKGIQNRKYYVRVAAYQTVSKVNYVSAWSKLKAIKAY